MASNDSGTRLYWLGSGHAFLLRTGGTTALIDGSSKPFQLLERLGQVLPFNTRTIDLVVVTDPRASNVSGVEAVLAHYQVSEVLDVGAEYASTTYARWRADLRSRGVPVYALRTGASARIGSVLMTSLGPDALYSNPADCIGLVRLAGPHRTVLLVGSASPREQLEAVFRPIHLHADTLVMDGSKGYVPSFLRAVHPATMLTRAPPPLSFDSRRLKDGQDFSLDL
jgi:beta-lactamase superfamily II metal-dependent hydrolase